MLKKGFGRSIRTPTETHEIVNREIEKYDRGGNDK